VLGTKVVDAVGDVRAHPTGDMGSIGLAGSPKQMIQTAVGGNRDENRYIELVVRGATAKVSPVLRTAADQAGGFIASCRNPVRAKYVQRHAALGGITMALDLGEAIIEAEKRGGSAVIDAIVKTTGGTILVKGPVTKKELVYTNQAFDIGHFVLGEGDKAVKIHVMNEYMAIDDVGGTRLATFPDVITTLDAAGTPLSAGQLREGMYIFVLHVPKKSIPLSSSVLDPAVYPPVEKAMGIDLARYALAGVKPRKKTKGW
jgi:DUF917 family protein